MFQGSTSKPLLSIWNLDKTCRYLLGCLEEFSPPPWRSQETFPEASWEMTCWSRPWHQGPGLSEALARWDGGAGRRRGNTASSSRPPGAWARHPGQAPRAAPAEGVSARRPSDPEEEQVGAAAQPGAGSELLSLLHQEAHKKTDLWVARASPVSTRLAPGKGQQRGVENNARL